MIQLNLVPDPKESPNGYVALSWASVAALLVVELHNRLGIDISIEEASVVVGLAAPIILFLKKKV